jgi:hypothetical protein
MDHSEVVAPELARRDGETDAERAARIDAVIANRVPDVRFLLDHLLGGGAGTVAGTATGNGTFAWGRDVPTLYLAAEQDVPVPLAGVHELFDRTPGSKRLLVLRRADHQHFVDEVEREHEAVRAMSFPDEAAWIPAAMRPIADLCPGEQAHLFVRGLTLGHLDATLRQHDAATRFLAGGVEAELAARGVEAIAHRP